MPSDSSVVALPEKYELVIPKEGKNFRREMKELHKGVNAMIIDDKTKRRYFRHVDSKYIPEDSFEKDYPKCDAIHILGRKPDGTLWTIMPHLCLIDNESPVDFFIAKHCAEEVNETYGLSISTWHKIGIGVFIVLIISIIVVIFLIVQSSSGGVVA